MDTEIVNSNAERWSRGMSLYQHPLELGIALHEAIAHFSRILNRIDPHHKWEILPQISDANFNWRRRPTMVDFNCLPVEYFGEATDLVHLDTTLTPDAAELTLFFEKNVAHCRIKVRCDIFSKLSEDERNTLRMCGALKTVTESHSHTSSREVVQCEL